MCFRLVYEDSEFQVALPFEAHIEDRLFRIVREALNKSLFGAGLPSRNGSTKDFSAMCAAATLQTRL